MSKIPGLSIGVLYTDQESLTPYHQLIYGFGFPRIIMPGERVGGLDAIIIPDNIGAYVGMACFASNRYQTIALKTLCPYAEVFRLDDRGLAYYKQKQILTIGVGHGRFMLWNDLGHRCIVSGTQVYLEAPQKNSPEVFKLEGRGIAEFRQDNYLGVESVHSPVLRTALTELKKIRFLEDKSESILPSEEGNTFFSIPSL